MEFSASLDPQARRITWMVHGMIALVLVFWADSYLEPGGISAAGIWYLFLPIFPLYAYFLLRRPLGYRLLNDRLELLRPLGSRHILLQDIVRCESVSEDCIRSSRRRLGMDGFHGYYGRYRHPRLGLLQSQATRLDSLILLELRSGERIVISPDRPGEFLRNCSPEPAGPLPV